MLENNSSNKQMTLSNALTTLWLHPRSTIQRLTGVYSQKNDLQATVVLTLGFLLIMTLFIWVLDVVPVSYFLSSKGIQTIGWSLLLVAAAIYTYANLTALMLWKMAGWLNGTGNLVSSRTAVLWSMISYLPLGFSILLIYFAYDQKILGRPIYLLDVVSLISFPLVFAYSFSQSLRMIAEIHQLRLSVAFFIVFLSALIQAGFVFLFITLLRN